MCIRDSTQKACLQLIQTGIGSDYFIIIALLASVIAEYTEILRQARILYHHAAAVAEGSDVLGGIEGKAAHISEGCLLYTSFESAVNSSRAAS